MIRKIFKSQSESLFEMQKHVLFLFCGKHFLFKSFIEIPPFKRGHLLWIKYLYKAFLFKTFVEMTTL